MADTSLTGSRDTRQALERLRERPLNFDPAELDRPDRWHVDERLQLLAAEAPGPPEEDRTWSITRRLMGGYEFADPSVVRAYYDPDVPLERRDLLLEIRFLVLRFRVGCRVREVYEREQQLAGRPAHVWGWSYATLAGHFEQGEMHWQVAKWPDTGEVAFRIQARSRRASEPNPVVRLGFRLFGRREQLRFYDSTCRRMRRLTDEALGSPDPAEAVRRVAEEETAGPADGREAARDELARNVERRRR